MSQPYRFRVEIHRFPVTSKQVVEPVDVTRFVTGFTVRLSHDQPWETLELELAMPRPLQFLSSVVRPNVGNWLVVYDDKYGGEDKSRAIFWGYGVVRRGEIRVEEDGSVTSMALPFQAMGWLDFLGRVRVQKAPGVIRSIGTLLGPGDWDRLFKGLASSSQFSTEERGVIKRRDVGEGLKPLIKVLGAVLLPPSLGGRGTVETVVADRQAINRGVSDEVLIQQGLSKTVSRPAQLGDRIEVVHNSDTRDQFAPNVVLDPVPGWTIRGLQAFSQSEATALQLILGTFSGDVNMVELYPSLEDPGVLETKKAVPQSTPRPFEGRDADDPLLPSGDSVAGGDTAKGKFTFGALSQPKKPKEGTAGGGVGKPAKDKKAPTLANDTAKALGANPVLIYRVKPWRNDELLSHVQRDDVVARNVPTGRILDDVFRGVTWRGNRGSVRAYETSDITSVDWEFDDGNHVNCVTVGLPTQHDSAIKWIERAGLPLIPRPLNPLFPGEVARRGLRVYEPIWPFFPPLTKEGDVTSLMDALVTVAAQAAQFQGAADRFAVGSVDMRYDATIRPGMFADIQIPEVEGGVTLRAYVDTVEHRIMVHPQGEIEARTVIAYSRGLFDESWSDRDQQFKPEPAPPKEKRKKGRL